jgi:hypothetical protein
MKTLKKSGIGGEKMARRAKCKICGKELDTNLAYKVESKPPKYFCSEVEYKAEEERKRKAAEDKDRVYRLICDIMCEQEIINSALWKEVQIWHQVADDEKIAKYLEENKDYLTSALSRVTSSEYARIRYLSAVVKNSIKDFKPRVIEEVRVQPKVTTVDETMYDTTPITTRKRRRSLDDLEDEI